ncbi:unnamed protein product [Polarella glacialis]|uniref:Uncharacterized protein n=1 Tax=Polarella glacialis TaxID=89957 RepID=A0A813H8L3_POLGL|nr:unnamed protein product [Polarella glacialis]
MLLAWLQKACTKTCGGVPCRRFRKLCHSGCVRQCNLTVRFLSMELQARFHNLISRVISTFSEATVKWQVVLVAPVGFVFPTESKFSDRCSSFHRWGGKDSYDQLPETVTAGGLKCVVRTKRSILIDVPNSLVNETRFSFRLNVTVAANREDVATQDYWRLTILESGQVLHSGESASPLLGTYYEATWFWAP